MFAPAHIAVSPVSSHFTYDNNGNITNNDNTTYTWDYQNRLIQTGGIATSTYAYDHTGARVKLTEGGTTTYFPNTLYNVTASSTTKHIFAHGSVIATVEKSNGTATLRSITTDHLNGVNIVTDPSGTIVETLDYYPYGTIRTDTKVGSYVGEKRKFIGQEYDNGTQLNYLNARYYDANKGKFVSQDPVFWEIKQNLANPQSLNSYSYAENNPIVKSDPTGRCVGPLAAVCIGGGVGAIGGVASQAFSDYLTGDFSGRSWQENLGTYTTAAVSGAVVGAGTVSAAMLAPVAGLGAGATAVAVGGTSGALTLGTTYGGNYLLNKPTDPTSAFLNSSVSALTAGTLKTLPQVRGRLPNFGTQAFYTGAHTQRQAAEEVFSNSVQTFSQTTARFVSTQSSSANVSRGSTSSLIQQLQSLVSSLQRYVASLGSAKSGR